MNVELPVPPEPSELAREMKIRLLSDPNAGPTEWEAAFHEAGHVVAEAKIAGSLPDAVRFGSPENEFAGRTESRSFLDVRGMLPRLAELDEAQGAFVRQRASAKGAWTVGGDLATYLAMELENVLGDLHGLAISIAGDGGYVGSDHEEMIRLATAMAPDDIEGWIEERLQEALGCLRSNWTSVTLVAQLLVAHRVVIRDDLEWLLES
jgi:hypothetical protein